MRRFLSLWALGLIFAAAACEDNPAAPAGRTELGPATAFGSGTVRSWVAVDGAGVPTALGMRWSASAMTGLPMNPMEVVPALPADAPVPPFDHLTLGWMPHGHPPDGVYTVPHFDIHAYFLTPAERAAISPADPEFGAKGARAPDPSHVPAGYVATPGAVPGMGAHWIDPTSSEFAGAPFDATFQYGVWDGRIAFMEPMFAKSFLDARGEASGTVAQPAAWAEPGYYPTRWSLTYDDAADEYVLTLDELVSR